LKLTSMRMILTSEGVIHRECPRFERFGQMMLKPPDRVSVPREEAPASLKRGFPLRRGRGPARPAQIEWCGGERYDCHPISGLPTRFFSFFIKCPVPSDNKRSHKVETLWLPVLVEHSGIEPLTSTLPVWRSPKVSGVHHHKTQPAYVDIYSAAESLLKLQ